MKRYRIESVHEVYEDHYDEGEGEYVNCYMLDAVINAENEKEAIEEYFKDHLYYSYDLSDADINKPYLSYCVMVDAENSEVGPDQLIVKQWKEGKSKLYINRIDITLSEVTQINLEEALLGGAEA